MTAGIANLATAAVWHPACSLPAELRAFVAALAHLADWRTGRGLSGQARVAAAMGISDRQVRRLRAQLEALGETSPVQVAWAPRGTPTGRTSDAYQIHLTQTGQYVRNPGGKPDNPGGETGQDVRQSPQGTPEGVSPEVFGEKNSGGSPRFGEARRMGMPANWTPRASEAALAVTYSRDLQHAVATFRLHAAATGRKLADWDAAFALWLLNGAQPSEARAAREAAATARRSAAVKAWQLAAATAHVPLTDPAMLPRRARGNRTLARAAARVLGCRVADVTYTPAQCATLCRTIVAP